MCFALRVLHAKRVAEAKAFGKVNFKHLLKSIRLIRDILCRNLLTSGFTFWITQTMRTQRYSQRDVNDSMLHGGYIRLLCPISFIVDLLFFFFLSLSQPHLVYSNAKIYFNTWWNGSLRERTQPLIDVARKKTHTHCEPICRFCVLLLISNFSALCSCYCFLVLLLSFVGSVVCFFSVNNG